MTDTATLKLPSWQRGSMTGGTAWDSIELTVPPYPTIKLGPPGMLIKIIGADQNLRVDHKKGAGVDGGDAVLKGLETPKFIIEARIWDADGEEKWIKAVPILFPIKDAKKRTLVYAYHPSLARMQMDTLQIQKIGEDLQPDGVLLVKLGAWSYRKKDGATHKATKKPKVQIDNSQTNSKFIKVKSQTPSQREAAKLRLDDQIKAAVE
jgi:hypothetical protein